MMVWLESMRLLAPGPAGASASTSRHVPPSSSIPDTEARRLAAAVARGDENAFQELYDRYQQRLFRFGVVLSHGNEALAGEMVQSVFVTAAAKLRRVDSEEHLWNWLARVGRQQILKMQRRHQRDGAALDIAEWVEAAPVVAVERKLEETLDAALAELCLEDRQVIEWFYFDNLSHKEIAERLDLTPKAVSSRLERARAWLRTRVQRSLSCER